MAVYGNVPEYVSVKGWKVQIWKVGPLDQYLIPGRLKRGSGTQYFIGDFAWQKLYK